MTTKKVLIGSAVVASAILLARYGFSRGKKIVPPAVSTAEGGGGAPPPVYGEPASPVLPPALQVLDTPASVGQSDGGAIITPHAPMPISTDAFFKSAY